MAYMDLEIAYDRVEGDALFIELQVCDVGKMFFEPV